MTDPEVIERIEKQNNMKAGTITGISPLLRKNNHDSDKVKLHHSIVLSTNDRHAANKCIENGCYIEYLHHAAERFNPQRQIMQCFNCCEYGHRAANCKRHSRCGKCGEKHNTRECKGSHEAWHFECPARIAESKRLDELTGSSSDLFN